MYLIFDIGGTKMRVAASSDLKTFKTPVVASTPKNFDQGMKAFKSLVEKITTGEPVKAVAGGVPGVLDAGKTKLIASPHLPNWKNKPLGKTIEKITGAKVIIENDAALAGLGEAAFGAGKDKKIVAYITISTGIGGARVTNCKIDKTSFGFEPGHQIVNASGSFKDLQSQIDGTALKKRFGRDPQKITDKKVWAEVAQYIAYSLHNITVFWSPDIIVLGGGMMKNPAIKLNGLKQRLRKTLDNRYPKLPIIKKTALGGFNVLYGALEILKK